MARADAMSQEALQACIRDEQPYQFTHFSHRDAWELGHAQVSTTSDIYAHVIAQADAQSADMLSDIYFKKAQTG